MGKISVTDVQVDKLETAIKAEGEETRKQIKEWVMDLIYGVNRNNGIHGKIKENTEAIKELNGRIDCIEKKPAQGSGDPWEKKYKIERMKTIAFVITSLCSTGGLIAMIAMKLMGG